MRTLNEQLYSGSANSSFQTDPLALEFQLGFSMQVVISGTATGTINLQGSNDFGTVKPAGPDTGVPGVTNWTDIANSSGPVTGAGTFTWNFNGTFFKWVRVNYVAASGTGTMIIRANTKGF